MLLYHRVGEAVVDPWALAVSPTHFSEHMELLRGRTVSLRDMLRSFRASTLEPDTVAVTFDDGYAETITIARPILERREIPATFYVPTGAINSAREFWWDELERLILISEHLPERLSIVIGGQQFNWAYPRSQQDRWTDQDRVRARTWQAWEVPAPSPRHELYASLWERCQRLPTADRERVLGELRLWAGARPPRGTHRTLTDREVQDLSSSAIADIGAHTVTHPALATLGSAAQRSEIDMGKRGLEQMIGRSVDTFAYPFGRRVDYTEETVRLVQNAGFEGACSNFPGAVVEGVDPFQLPRLFVQDWDGDEFNRRLTTVAAHG